MGAGSTCGLGSEQPQSEACLCSSWTSDIMLSPLSFSSLICTVKMVTAASPGGHGEVSTRA